MTGDLSVREKLHAFYLIATYRPRFTAGIIAFSLFTAVFEGIGVTFIVPLVEVASSPGVPTDGIAGVFASAYTTLGIPFTLGTIVAGLAAVLVVRYVATFLGEWARIHLRIGYVSDLQTRSFEHALSARIEYFDREGSGDILNAIITQASKAGQAIEGFVYVFRYGVLILMYLCLALYLAPELTVVSAALVVGSIAIVRWSVESGYSVGDRVADANETIQSVVQAGTQGIREVKTIQYADELLREFEAGMGQFVDSSIRVKRNEALIGNSQDLFVALIVFVLIYAALTFTSMTFGALGAFLFVMFKLGPVVSSVNKRYYQLEGLLPHLVRTERFIEELRAHGDIVGGDRDVPDSPAPIRFDDVRFSYDGDEAVLSDISLHVDEGEFVALVGESGAGKSTIASLLARLYVQDAGEITAAGAPLEEYDVEQWRSRIAYVRQDPFIFDATLRENLLMANPDATTEQMEQVCRIAQVTEFLDDLPAGYDTALGDNGVRLSGGQRQRVALARALLQDADILILDEATSDLDTRIEHRVQSGIETMDREFTVVAIAHRLSTVKGADRIYTLDDGEIVEAGEHESLLDNEGQYADLYQPQGAVQ
jgi:subfamily B ATP-binding cassette protein MsbA